MSYSQRKITIGQREYWISMDPDYGKHLGERFEPNTVALLECLSSPDSRILDIGANIGITGVLLAQLSPDGSVTAIEPVPAAYKLLSKNVGISGHKNIRTCNFALGKTEGEVVMQGNPNNLSGSFVSDIHNIDDGLHFKEVVRQHALDDVFDSLGFERLDLIKIDVEGYELDVLEGAKSVLARYQPIVTLEMNYVALNLWRNMSVPEFRTRLLDIFPFVYAVNEGGYINFRDEKLSHDVLFNHLTKWAFMDIVAGFDVDALTNRLERLEYIRHKNEIEYARSREPNASVSRVAELQAVIDHLEEDLNCARESNAARDREFALARERIHAIEGSHSWMLTAPLRGLMRSFRKR
jgi:FkbM family methyltransferase